MAEAHGAVSERTGDRAPSGAGGGRPCGGGVRGTDGDLAVPGGE